MRRIFCSLAFSGILSAQSVSITPDVPIATIRDPSVRLDFETTAGRYYQIESSTDLMVWKREGHAFAGNGGRMAAMVSNHGLPRLFYRVGNNGKASDVAPINPYGPSAPATAGDAGPSSWNDLTDKPATLAEAGFATGSSALAREVGAVGFNAVSSDNTHVWRIIEKINRERNGQGNIARDRFRSVSFGDSVAVRISSQATGFWGFGGADAFLQAFAKEAPPTPASENTENYPQWSSGVFSLYDEWHRTPGGLLVHLDAGIPGGTHIERANYPSPMHSVVVTFMAKDSTGPGDASYGSFKLQYKPNNTGEWIDCNSATVAPGKGSANGGLVQTDNDSPTERVGMAVFNLPRSDTYAIRLAVTAGRVRLTKVLFNQGGLAVGPSDQVQLGGSIEANFAQGSRGIASHFSRMTQEGLHDALGYIDPHVVLYKSANQWSLQNYQTYWPALAEKLMTAAPNATLIVAGSHPQDSNRGHEDPAIAVDDYLREWCAQTPGAIFVDVRQNFPEYEEGFHEETASIDDLWTDGVHIGGKGDQVISQLVWDAIEPAMEYAKTVQSSHNNWSNILPMVPSEIRLFDERGISNRTNKLAFTVHPRSPASVMIRSTSAPFVGYDQSWSYESGLYTRAATDTQPNALTLFSDGWNALTFGHHSIHHLPQGWAVGIPQSHTVNAHRAADGYRFRVVNPYYGVKPGLIVEGRHDSPSTTRLLGIDVNSTDAAAGTPLWSWLEDGKVVFEGNTADEHQMTLEFAEPASDITLTTPAKSGTIGVVPPHASEAQARAAGLGPGDNYWNTTTGSLKTILP